MTARAPCGANKAAEIKVYKNIIRINWFIKIKAYFQFVLTNIYLTHEFFVFNISCSFLSLDFKNRTCDKRCGSYGHFCNATKIS